MGVYLCRLSAFHVAMDQPYNPSHQHVSLIVRNVYIYIYKLLQAIAFCDTWYVGNVPRTVVFYIDDD